MCGIIGVTNTDHASSVVLHGLRMLEYRGYDSWGVALRHEKIFVVKRMGKISDFNSSLPESSTAIGHSRWATHGAVTEENAHPHLSCDKKIAVVHNGIIENFEQLKQGLKDHNFCSDTDTEVIPHLIEENMAEGFTKAVRKTALLLEGRYAFLAMKEDESKIIAARRGSPLVIGIGRKEFYVASDVPAFLDKTNKVVYLEDDQMAVLNSGLKIYDIASGQEIMPKIMKLDWHPEQAGKGGCEHYMLKEILEQKHTLANALNQSSSDIARAKTMIENAHNLFLTGAGTAGSVCFLGEYLFSMMARKRAMYIPAGEFVNYKEILREDDVLIVVSQSGETADALESIDIAKSRKAKIISIVNVPFSSMTRKSDITFPVGAGPEKAVCSTKATTAQMAVLILLIYSLIDRFEEGTQTILAVQTEAKEFLSSAALDSMKKLASLLGEKDNVFIIGRGIHYPIAVESSIKLQEVSYLHTHAFSGSELKHGPIALITKESFCIAFVPEDETKKDIMSNILELKARGAKIIAIGMNDNDSFDQFIKVGEAGIATPLLSLIPIQLLAYYLAVLRGNNPDYPRNLAKSVTVK